MQSSEQDQISSGMEDPTMTIKYLRTQLLSERSVSKTARQRANELAERVVELEEQLRIVSLQRMKAEKATAEVLAILETNGIDDASDAFYSSSDQDGTPKAQKLRDNSTKGENSADSKDRGNGLEDYSGSEFDCSAHPGRCLSWKGRKDSMRSLDKYKDFSTRRRSSFASINSSSKHRSGKSCRQIKRREHRSEATHFVEDSAKVDSQNNEATSTSEGHQNLSDTGAQMSGGYTKLLEPKVSAGKDESHVMDEVLEGSEEGADKDMERALEHQRQLISQYKDMEKAQREWEEKFRENNCSTTDSYDPGNHSDITEDREESKSQAAYPHEVVSNLLQDTGSEVKGTPNCNGFSETQPSNCVRESSQPETGSLQLQKEDQDQKCPYVISNGPTVQENPQNHCLSPSHSSLSQSKVEPYALVPHQTSDPLLSGVLNNLKQAKLLLHKQMISRSPLPPGAPPVPPTGYAEKMDIPGGCTGLFRLPTDFSLESPKGNLLHPNARISPSYYPQTSALITSSEGRSLSSRYAENTAPSLPRDDKFLINPRLDPYLDPIAATSRSRQYPQYPSYPDLIPRMPSNEEFQFQRLAPDITSGMPPPDRFMFHSDGGRPNMMYR